MVVLVEVPENFTDMVNADPSLAQAWRQHSRSAFEQILASGYTITDFVRGVHEGRQRSFYALSITDAPARGFSYNYDLTMTTKSITALSKSFMLTHSDL